ncbi:MAG TPA: SDR family NAD(P)-dependent oxidoreductase, partial [Frankiaceae bacterium]|nr:SDR family NAD(P)-dependent oxidoreductase [Frankiaceae bacterium]
MTAPGRFVGKVALVTGAGSGMGRAISLRLEAEGASVFAVDISKGRLDETLEMSSG